MKLCPFIVLVMAAIIMVYSILNVGLISLANHVVIYDVTTIAEGSIV